MMNENNIQNAATLLQIKTGQSGAIEILMVKRHHNLAFAANAWVFPGGKFSKIDYEIAKNNNINKAYGNNLEGEEIVAKICAIRETFEETGILWAYNKNDELVIDKYSNEIELRKSFEKNNEAFEKFIKSENLKLAIDRLIPISIWIPPNNINRRYRTYFFLAFDEKGANFLNDGQEIIKINWKKPKEVLELSDKNEIKLIFPTMANLKLIEKFNNYNDLKNYILSKKMPIMNPDVEEIAGERWVKLSNHDFYPDCEHILVKN